MPSPQGNYGLLADSPLRLVSGAIKEFTLYSYDVTLDEDGAESTRARSDLTSAVLTWRAYDQNGNVLLIKTSADTDQIEIAADPTTGIATLKFVAADTNSTLTPGQDYFHDMWCVYQDGRADRIIKRSRFYIDK